MNIMICDDNQMFTQDMKQRVENHLKNHSYIHVSTLTSFQEFDLLLPYIEYDVILIDTTLNGKSTFSLVSQFIQKNPDCMVIFISDHTEHIPQAFEVHAFQFLPKNVDDVKLFYEIDRFMKCYRKKKAQCVLYTSEGQKAFLPKDIIYIETRNRQVKMSTISGTYTGKVKNLLKMKSILLDYDYFQIHQSFFLNMNHIEYIKKGAVKLINGEVIPTSILHRDYVKAKIQHFLKTP